MSLKKSNYSNKIGERKLAVCPCPVVGDLIDPTSPPTVRPPHSGMEMSKLTATAEFLSVGDGGGEARNLQKV